MALSQNEKLTPWSYAPSLGEYVGRDSYPSLGLAATILDGKACLRELTPDANKILFGDTPGLYRHSQNRRILVILFNDRPHTGVVFVQAK